MIITQVDIWTVVVPVFPETVHSEEYGGYPDWARVPKQIIRLLTDEGFTGIGETGRGQSKEAVVQAAEQLKNRDVMKMCLQNVFRQEPLKPTPEAPSQWEIDLGPYPAGYEAFETAIFDLIGKRLGVPIHQVTRGGLPRTSEGGFLDRASDPRRYKTQHQDRDCAWFYWAQN